MFSGSSSRYFSLLMTMYDTVSTIFTTIHFLWSVLWCIIYFRGLIRLGISVSHLISDGVRPPLLSIIVTYPDYLPYFYKILTTYHLNDFYSNLTYEL